MDECVCVCEKARELSHVPTRTTSADSCSTTTFACTSVPVNELGCALERESVCVILLCVAIALSMSHVRVNKRAWNW